MFYPILNRLASLDSYLVVCIEISRTPWAAKATVVPKTLAIFSTTGIGIKHVTRLMPLVFRCVPFVLITSPAPPPLSCFQLQGARVLIMMMELPHFLHVFGNAAVQPVTKNPKSGLRTELGKMSGGSFLPPLLSEVDVLEAPPITFPEPRFLCDRKTGCLHLSGDKRDTTSPA